jgi:hypothetical protein
LNESDALISRLAGLAQHDSAGNFSLDPARARLLLEKYRLPAPEYFMLHAVGAAVASGATQVAISLRSDRFRLVFDGTPFGPQDPQECFTSLWGDERDPAQFRLRELAVAQGGAWEWGADQFRLAPEGGRQMLSVQRTGWKPALMRFLGPLGRSEQEQLLVGHLVPTPTCQLLVNGHPLPPLVLPKVVLTLARLGFESSIESHTPPRELHLNQFPWLEPEERALLASARGLFCVLLPQERSPAIWDGTRGSAQRKYWPGYLDLVLNGRLYRCSLPHSHANCWGILWLTGLRRDLSHTMISGGDLAVLFRVLGEALHTPKRYPLSFSSDESDELVP